MMICQMHGLIFISFSSIHCRANNIANSSIVNADKWSVTLFLIKDSLTAIYTAAAAHPVSGSLGQSVNIITESEKMRMKNSYDYIP